MMVCCQGMQGSGRNLLWSIEEDMPEFRFRQFTVSNDRSAMKVNTDGVLLGAVMAVSPDDRHLLDVGTGTGTVALMAVQRLYQSLYGESGMPSSISRCSVKADSSDDWNGVVREVSVEGMDIDAASAEEAAENFASSPWGSVMKACHSSLAEFANTLQLSRAEEKYDLIFSNPPYFESSLKAPDARRRAARHADTLSYRDIVAFSSRWLAPCGRLAMILPADIEMEAKRYAVSWDLYPFRMTRVRSTARRPVSRIVMEFARSGASLSIFGGVRGTAVDRFAAGPGCPPAESVLTIMDKGGYSSEYRSLVSDFLLV